MYKKIISLCITSVVLSGCNDSDVNAVKSSKIEGFENYTYGQVLDDRKVCSDTEWEHFSENDIRTVTYRCTLKKGKVFFSFDDNYMETLSKKTYEDALKKEAKKTEDEIKKTKEKIKYNENEIRRLEAAKEDKMVLFSKNDNEELTIYSELLNTRSGTDTVNNINSIHIKYMNKMEDASGFRINNLVSLNGDRYQSYHTLSTLYSYLNTASGSSFQESSEGRYYHDTFKSRYDYCINKQKWAEVAREKNVLLNNSEWRKLTQNKKQETILNNCRKENKDKEPNNMDALIEQCIFRNGNIDFNAIADSEARGKVEQELAKNIEASCDSEEAQVKDALKKELIDILKLAKPVQLKIVDEKINILSNQNKEDANYLAYLNSDKNVEDSKKSAEKSAGKAVNKYAMTHVMQGTEVITWEYDNVNKEFFIKSKFMRQMEYGNKYTDFNLYMDKIILSATRNINDVDQYMEMRRQDAINALNKLIYNQ
ncbi:hypothetical protein [Salmonella enterica]|uniref:hypothetical protein n=1 Tax=Salmonella enterica TaxID=28901 RepID=UPI0021D4ABE1|nr:hypothetical protein [Salmonella enterica]MCU7085905.1 hypothetical protein [Salmonella enterica]MCU7142662.1 hypothetical protein [Salmonella enterica]